MNRTQALLTKPVSIVILVLGGFFLTSLSVRGQGAPHLSVTTPGGMPGKPVITGIARASNSVSVTWDGPSGYYQLHQKATLKDPRWQAVGGPNLTRHATVNTTLTNSFFEVSGPAAHFAGAQDCAECHGNFYRTVLNTAHAQAFDLLKMFHEETNATCLPCHTLGFRLPTGFVSATATPQLANVQCENCHGAAANHAANENDPTVRPRVELAATVCGGCHSGVRGGSTFDEWQTSPHGAVVPDALAVMNTSTNNLSACGRCHSGSVRLSLLKREPLPVGDADVPIVCSVCHNPHLDSGNPVLLRNPLASTNDYFLTTSDNFTTKYNPQINICGQCHNHRGASWTDNGRSPHHSPQYNMLLGTVGELLSGARPSQPGTHALRIPDQCAGCHMQMTEAEGENPPSNTGHAFEVQSFDLCLNCHPLPEGLLVFTTNSIGNQIQKLKSDLDLWANTKAPSQLTNKYHERSWEYTIPGTLSAAGPGPNTAEQALIPVNIKKARFNLYLVFYDGSFGVHNAIFTTTLLDAAQTWIQIELGK